jgi:hypothetical protein
MNLWGHVTMSLDQDDPATRVAAVTLAVLASSVSSSSCRDRISDVSRIIPRPQRILLTQAVLPRLADARISKLVLIAVSVKCGSFDDTRYVCGGLMIGRL